jgi:hypothetical protein
VDSSIRASAFAGLGAFALSVIVAVFSRVPFGALFLRALLSGVGFAGLTFGAILLLKRFLPEIFDDSARPQDTGADPAIGSLVDIVLPGGDEARPESGQGARPASSSRDADLESLPSAYADSVDSGELAREVASLRSDALVANDPGDTSPESAGSVAPRPSVSLDELDTLPDLEGFSDSFAEGQPGDSDYSDSPGGGAGGSSSRLMGVSDTMPTAGSPDAGRDPVVLAKAVQTLLRRDQKGQ